MDFRILSCAAIKTEVNKSETHLQAHAWQAAKSVTSWSD